MLFIKKIKKLQENREVAMASEAKGLAMCGHT
jgi:hypothetical protein